MYKPIKEIHFGKKTNIDKYLKTEQTSKFFTISNPDLIEDSMHKYLKEKDIRHHRNPDKYDFPFTLGYNRIKFRIL